MRDAESCVCVWRATQHPEHEFSSNGRAPRLTTRDSSRNEPKAYMKGMSGEPAAMKARTRAVKRPLFIFYRGPHAPSRENTPTRDGAADVKLRHKGSAKDIV